jgi:sensor histidine kinase YesM
MKRAGCSMNIKFNTLLYVALFSGLGVFSFLLLINYATFPDKVADIFHSVGTLAFFILTFNVLGYATIRLSTWMDNQYALNLHRRWKLISIYIIVMGMFFLLNYGLLVTAKLLAGAAHPFMFPNGGWRILITVWLVELVILGLLLANRSMRNTLQLQQEAAALQKENNTARYTALQNQLNPHFLFNSLNTLISEIRYNPANAELFTQHLSDVYRYTLQCQNQRLTTLREELEFLNSYIFLHRVRLGDCIHIDNRLPEACLDFQLPPLTIQLLAENVIKHNVIHMGKPMTIELFYMEKEKELVVRNRIQAKKSATTFGTGLKNLSARYKLLCNRDIVIENNLQEFTVKIPLLHE